MRTIKFMAWDKKDKRMVIDEQDFIPIKVTNKGVLRLNPHYQDNFWQFVSEDRFEIMQFTGLTDKNGKEIYEGDIIEMDGGGPKVKGQIIFEDGCFCFKAPWVKEGNSYPELKYYTVFSSLPNDAIFKDCIMVEKIGNVFETPELLNN